jgi:predicted cobalt transporter CbtA
MGTDREPPDSPDPTVPAAAHGEAGWTPIDEFDSLAEVDATFRTQRRIAVGYFVLFLVLTLAVPTLTLVLDWWSDGRVVGGMSPNFLMAAGGLYVCFFALGLAASTLATAVEDRMLGGPRGRRDGEG